MGRNLTPVQAHDILRDHLGRLAPGLGLNPAQARRLSARAQARLYAARDLVLPAQESAGCLCLVVAGQVAVYTARWGGSVPVAILGPGDTFGQALLVADHAGEATLRALTQCEVWCINRANLSAPSSRHRARSHSISPGRWAIEHPALLILSLAVLLLLGLAPVQRSLALIPMGLGQWCRERDLPQCAQPVWRLAAAMAPDDANPLLALGILYAEQGEQQAAEQYLQAALALSPDSAEVNNNLGYLYASHHDYQRAVDAFRRALSLDPGAATIHSNLAQSLQASQRHAEALTHYQAAIALGGDQGQALVNMAIAYYEMGQLAKATETAGTALLYDRSLSSAYTVLGAVSLKAKQPQAAVDELRRAVALDADNGWAYYHLGLAYQALGQTAEATLALERALVAAGDDEVRSLARQGLDRLRGKAAAGRTP